MLVCLRTAMVGGLRVGWFYGRGDAVGSLGHPEAYDETRGADGAVCTFSSCREQDLNVPVTTTPPSRDAAGLCGVIYNSLTNTSHELWCYFDFFDRTFCGAVTTISNGNVTRNNQNNNNATLKQATIYCRTLDWTYDFILNGQENSSIYSVFIKPGACNEGTVSVPNIFEGMTDDALNEANLALNNILTCPFDKDDIALAQANFTTKTYIRKQVCQPPSYCMRPHYYEVTGQAVTAFVIDKRRNGDEGYWELVPMHGQRRGDQVCFTYQIMENIIFDQFYRCSPTVCVDVGSEAHFYYGNSSNGHITNVAILKLQVTDEHHPNVTAIYPYLPRGVSDRNNRGRTKIGGHARESFGDMPAILFLLFAMVAAAIFGGMQRRRQRMRQYSPIS